MLQGEPRKAWDRVVAVPPLDCVVQESSLNSEVCCPCFYIGAGILFLQVVMSTH